MLLHINPTRQRGKRTGSLARASGWYMTFFAAVVIALGTPQPPSLWMAPSETRTYAMAECTLGVSRRARWLMIMVAVFRGDLLPTTANIALPKSRFHRTTEHYPQLFA